MIESRDFLGQVHWNIEDEVDASILIIFLLLFGQSIANRSKTGRRLAPDIQMMFALL
ncbi:hypothetical protein [Roseimicrobium gellanilyticum]|uniref:hypothetical protein n=1 Tax=Roseimicrobium gellanilyticum TaxID=748857 RepID=UPI001B87E602|nr:hypothetical protein [Roseimicrobium gellanilyticum]